MTIWMVSRRWMCQHSQINENRMLLSPPQRKKQVWFIHPERWTGAPAQSNAPTIYPPMHPGMCQGCCWNNLFGISKEEKEREREKSKRDQHCKPWVAESSFPFSLNSVSVFSVLFEWNRWVHIVDTKVREWDMTSGHGQDKRIKV